MLQADYRRSSTQGLEVIPDLSSLPPRCRRLFPRASHPLRRDHIAQQVSGVDLEIDIMRRQKAAAEPCVAAEPRLVVTIRLKIRVRIDTIEHVDQGLYRVAEPVLTAIILATAGVAQSR